MKSVRFLLATLSLLAFSACDKTQNNQYYKLSPPSLVILNDLTTELQGGSVYALSFQASSTQPLTLKSVLIEFSADGENYSTVDTLSGSSTSYNFNVPYINTKTADIRITVSDSVDNKAQSLIPFEVRSQPTLAFNQIASPLPGGHPAEVSFSVKGYGLTTMTLQFAADGQSFDSGANLDLTATNYSYPIPANLNTASAVFRLTVVDGAGNTDSVTSNAVQVISTPPTAPTISLPSVPFYANQTKIASFTVANCNLGYGGTPVQILITQTASLPTGTANWQACATSPGTVTYDLSSGSSASVSDGSYLLYAWAKDVVGNISAAATPVGGMSVIYDHTAPVIQVTSGPAKAGFLAGGGSFSLAWTATEANITTSQSFCVQLLTTSNPSPSATCPTVGGWQMPAVKGPMNAQGFTLNGMIPANLNTATASFYVSLVDLAGNVGSGMSNPFSIDSTVPTIKSFSVVDSTGNAVSLTTSPNVTFQLSASDPTVNGFASGVGKMCLWEGGTSCPSNGWVPFNSSAVFTLQPVNDAHTVYVQVADNAGNQSASMSYPITLDYNVIPTIAITSPLPGQTATSGQQITLSWNCETSSSVGLPANKAVAIQYTTDDGITFNPISGSSASCANGLCFNYPANNGSGGSQSVSWTSTTNSTVRFLFSCTDNAGVVANAYSQPINSTLTGAGADGHTPFWNVFAGNSTYGLSNVNAHIADVGGPTSSSITSDAFGNFFFVRNNAINRLDAVTGMVTTFAGQIVNGGCTVAAGKSPTASGSNLLTSPVILGANTAASGIFVYTPCNEGTIFLISTSNPATSSSVTVWDTSILAPSRVFNTGSGLAQFFFNASKQNLIFIAKNGAVFEQLYQLDLSKSNATAVEVLGGNGTCSTSNVNPPLNALATNEPFPNALNLGNCPQDSVIFSTVDASNNIDIIVNPYGPYASDAFLLIPNPDSKSVQTSPYIIGNNDLGWKNISNGQDCISTRFNSKVYCGGRYTSTTISVFDPNSATPTNPWTNECVPFDPLSAQACNGDPTNLTPCTVGSTCKGSPGSYEGGYLYLGSMQSEQIVAFYQANNIQTMVADTFSSVISVAGQGYSSLGNHKDLGFLPGASPIFDVVQASSLNSPVDLKYDPANQNLWIRENAGDVRLISMANTTYPISSIGTGTDNYFGVSTIAFGLQANATDKATKVMFLDGCQGTRLVGGVLDAIDGTYLANTPHNYLYGGCPNTPAAYPPPAGAPASTSVIYFDGTTTSGGAVAPTQTPLFHTNGLVYFSGYAGTPAAPTGVYIFSSDGSKINPIAGQYPENLLPGGAYPTSNQGQPALGAPLTYVYQLQEILSGPYTGDILIFDGTAMRRIGVTSDIAAGAGTPLIHNVMDFTTVTGFSSNPGNNFYDAFYDQLSETNGLGTGTTYYVRKNTAGSYEVHKASKGVDMLYPLNVAFYGSPRVAYIPAPSAAENSSLLVLDGSFLDQGRILAIQNP